MTSLSRASVIGEYLGIRSGYQQGKLYKYSQILIFDHWLIYGILTFFRIHFIAYGSAKYDLKVTALELWMGKETWFAPEKLDYILGYTMKQRSVNCGVCSMFKQLSEKSQCTSTKS